MESIEMKSSGKIYDPETDLWYDKNGVSYVRNEFDPYNIVWINVSGDVWHVEHNGRHCEIKWADLGLSKLFLEPFRTITLLKLKKNAPSYIVRVSHALSAVGIQLGPYKRSVGSMKLNELSELWGNLNSSYRVTFREFYVSMNECGIGGTNSTIALKMKKWKARSETKHLKDVLGWNETKGALTNAEVELVRVALHKPLPEDFHDSIHGGHLLTWMMFETLKRGLQLTKLIDDDLKVITDTKSGVTEYILNIPMVKAQTGMGKRMWPISTALAQSIMTYRKRPNIQRLSKKHNNLIMWESVDLGRGGILSSGSVGSSIYNYIANLDITSPRTNKKIKLSPVRIRHTGATLLAKNGVSKEIIQTVLEHDCPESAKAYINACGIELIPEIDRVDRTTNTFSELNDIFFKGSISSEVGDNPIVIPVYVDGLQPAIVGDCSKSTFCYLNPFFACYDGCNHFIAWREGEHQRALEFVNNLQRKWEKQEGKYRTNAAKNFERMAKSLADVINRIRECSGEPL